MGRLGSNLARVEAEAAEKQHGCAEGSRKSTISL
jgi:hypothetical protein